MQEAFKKKLLQELNNFFSHIYVLTLPSATERQQAIATALDGLNFSFFYGVDKNNLNIELLEANNEYSAATAIKHSRYNRVLRTGEIACSLGHKAIYEDIIKHNYANALILEDDVIINPHNSISFSDIVLQLPNNWHLLYLDYAKNDTNNFFLTVKRWIYHLQKTIGLLKWSHTAINHLHAKPYSKNLRKAGYHDYTSAYAITQYAAKVLLEVQTPVSFPSDNALAHAATNLYINGFITVPKFFEQLSQQKNNRVKSYVDA